MKRTLVFKSLSSNKTLNYSILAAFFAFAYSISIFGGYFLDPSLARILDNAAAILMCIAISIWLVVDRGLSYKVKVLLGIVLIYNLFSVK